jgi:predicted nucleic acid-binding protein
MDWAMKGARPMGLPNCLFDPSAVLVLDASVVINLHATGCAGRILGAIPNPIVILEVVLRELEAGRIKGRTDADTVGDLVKNGRVQLAALSPECESNFLALVAGSGSATLDDGEAATIAWSVTYGGIPIIDEKKGSAICRERFPHLQLGTTIDIFAHEQVQSGFVKGDLADAIFKALTLARMRVHDKDMAWVIGMIGQERASLCNSLPLSKRAKVVTERSRSEP